jgi:hypothetical protein
MLVEGEPLIVGETPIGTVLTASASCPEGWVAMGGGGYAENSWHTGGRVTGR